MNTEKINEQLEEVHPLECDIFPGYYHVPEEPNLIVSKDGNFKSYPKGKDLRISKLNSGYCQVNVTGKGSTRVHRQFAKTFIGRPLSLIHIPFKDLEINHKNGQRDDNSLDNLEWVTSSGNSRHSHLFLGHSTDIPVLAKSLFDDKIFSFHSIETCASKFQIKNSTLWKHLKSGNSGKFEKYGYVFKIDDGSEWVIPPKYLIKELGAKQPMKTIVNDNKTNKVYIFSSIKDAVLEFNLKITAVWKNLKRYGKHTDGDLVFTLA